MKVSEVRVVERSEMRVALERREALVEEHARAASEARSAQGLLELQVASLEAIRQHARSDSASSAARLEQVPNPFLPTYFVASCEKF